MHQPNLPFFTESTDTQTDEGLAREAARAPVLRYPPPCGRHHCGPQTQGVWFWGTGASYTLSPPPPGFPVPGSGSTTEMTPPAAPPRQAPGLGLSGRGRAMTPNPHPPHPASTFLCSRVVSPPPIWLPPSPLQEPRLPRTLLSAAPRSAPLHLEAPCRPPAPLRSPSRGLEPGPAGPGVLVFLFSAPPGRGLNAFHSGTPNEHFSF